MIGRMRGYKRLRASVYAGLVLGIALLLAASIWFFHAGFQKDVQKERGRLFGLTISTLNNPFCTYFENTLRTLVEADGNRLITYDPQYDQHKQIEQIEAMLNEGIELLFLCPVDYRKITPALLRCEEADVPIINYDCEVEKREYVDSIVVSDNYSAGYKCARDIARRLPNGAKIAIVDDEKAVSVVSRMKGFRDGLLGPSYEIIARVDSDGSLEGAMPIVMGFLAEYPNLEVIMCANDTVASGAVAAIEVMGMEGRGILVYGIDGSPDAKSLIRDGRMTATMAQSPIQMAGICYEQANRLLAGKSIESEVFVEVYMIDDGNVRNYDISSWQ